MVQSFHAGKEKADPVVPKTLVHVLATGDPGFSYVLLREAALTNGGTMALHQNCAFAAATIEGVSLTNGIYSWSDLVARFPGNFAPNGGGYLAVQPYGSSSAFPAPAWWG